MAAKLEWAKGALTLGGLIVAGTTLERRGWEYRIPSVDGLEGGPYESLSDARQDCESEVRRLLKEAGVDVE